MPAFRLAARDPGLQSLRRAGRVAIVATGMFVLGLEVLDEPVLGFFGLFAAFSLLAFADFGGPPRSRALAYLSLTAIGAALVAVGTTVQSVTALAVALMVVVAFAVRLLGSFGGFWYASVSPAILSYVLATTTPGGTEDLGIRLAGWCLGGLAATVAALVLWPRQARAEIEEATAAALDLLADQIDAAAPGTPRPDADVEAIRARLHALDAALQVPVRPSGPGMHDVALRMVIDDVRRVAGVLLRPDTTDGPREVPPSAAGMQQIASRSLRAAARQLRREEVDDDLPALVTEREGRLDEVSRWVVDRLDGPTAAPTVLDALDRAFPTRIVTSLALAALANATVVRNGRVPGAANREFLGPPFQHRFELAAKLRLSPGTPAFQDAVRAAIALGSAVLIALTMSLDHGFWVVLGTLSVLRSNAFATGGNALRASLGTAIGFAATSLLFAVVGLDHAALWILTGVGLFAAAYAPQVFGFVAGQVAFTIAVVCAFNLIEPQGWHTGLTRVEDIVLGGVISLVVAFVFWPRRELRELRAWLGATLAGLGPALQDAVAEFGAGRDGEPASLDQAATDEQLARASYRVFVDETHQDPGRADPWGHRLAITGHLRGAMVLSLSARHRFPALGSQPAFRALTDSVATIADTLDDAAAAVRTGAAAPSPPAALPTVSGAVTPPVLDALGRAAGMDDPRAAFGLVWVREWLLESAELADELGR